MITILQDIPDVNFSGGIPSLKFTTTDDNVGIYLYLHEGDSKKEIFNEWFRPNKDGVIELIKVNEFIEPYLDDELNQVFSYRIVANDQDLSKVFNVQYCKVDMDLPALAFLKNFFLSTLIGPKTTLLDSPEFIHYYALEEDRVLGRAIYEAPDGLKEEEIIISETSHLNKVNTVEVSPSVFEKENKKLIEYTVEVGARKQQYIIDYTSVETYPRLLFTNSFGCQEVFICTGVEKLEPSFNRSSGYFSEYLKNYDVKEERIYKADTGFMTPVVANWAEDLIRSPEIYLLNGTVVGKEIVIVDSKSNRSRSLDESPSFTFDYRLSQRNHNILNFRNAGRIFDTTFDITFN